MMLDPLDDWRELDFLRERLDRHPVYGSLRTIKDLRCFMTHHIYSVWDFMSLVKTLQAGLAPAQVPWVPVGDPSVRRFVNQLVLEEESDLGPDLGSPAVDGRESYLSHFELYCGAMREIGADPLPALAHLERVRTTGIEAALVHRDLPEPSRRFMRTTFGFVASNKLHVVAAALALGREHAIPPMFRAFLRDMRIDETQAPMFHFYLNRHIHLDADIHAPLSLRLLAHACAGDALRIAEARDAARRALEARIAFWDGVAEAIAMRAQLAA